MQNSKIPVRTTTANSKRQVISDIQKENGRKSVQQGAKVAEKVQSAMIKQSNPVAKKTTTMRDTGKDNSHKNELAQRKGKQVSQPNLPDKSKGTLKNKEDAKQTNNQVLKEQNRRSEKPSSRQPSKVQADKDFHLTLKNRKPPKPITIPQIQNVSTSNANQKKSENHSSQPDIEFEPDENCLKRILSGRELSPAALKLPFRRAQSSFGGRFSNLHQPVRDPFKTLLKSLENMSTSRRSSVRKQFHPGSPHLYTPNPHKTPKLAFEITMRRLTDVQFKKKSKSAKKVTFKLPDAGLAQKVSCQDEKVEKYQLRLTDISEKSDISSQHSTPELDENLAKLIPSTSNTSYIGETPSMPSFKDALRECHLDNMESVRKPDKKLTGILRSNTLIAFTHDQRQNSNMNTPNAVPRKLRRSASASELDSCSTSKSSILKNADLKTSVETDLKKSSQVKSSMPSSNFHHFNTLRTINHSKVNDKFVMSNPVVNSRVETSSSIVAAALLARRESALLPRKHRRSMSASEVGLVSDPVDLHNRPLKSPSKIHIREESNQVHNSISSYQYANTRTLRTVSSPELRDKFDELDSNIQNTKMKLGISKDNDIAADSCESGILANRLRKHRRSMSASELDCFGFDCKMPKDKPLKSDSEVCNVELNRVYSSVASCQSVNTCNSKTQLSDRFSGVEASKVDSHAPNMQSTVRSNNIKSSTMFRSSLNAHNLRTSNSFTDLREKLSSITSTRKSEKNNPLLYSVNKDLNFKPNNLLLSSVRAAELRNSLYSAQRRNTIQSTYSQKLCTPCPVSLNPKSKAAQSSFSPEFLCRRTSNIISHAPIRTPLVMRQLAADELDDDDDDHDDEDHHLSPIRIKLDFEPTHQKEKDDSQGISKAYLQTFKTQQVITDCLADQECCIINSYADSFQHFPAQELSNPIAKTLEYGDEMHFVPVEEAG